MAAVTCYGETLTGVVYSNEIGNGSHPAGRFELAVGKKIQTVDYGEQLETHFQSGTCNDIGAEWSVEVTRLDNSLSAGSVACAGRADEDVHEPWLLLKNYLEGMPELVSQTSRLSPRYRSSPDFRHFVQDVSSHDLNFNFGPGDHGKCLKAVSVEPAVRTRMATRCAVQFQGKSVVLLFDVARSKSTGKWEIDRIKMQ